MALTLRKATGFSKGRAGSTLADRDIIENITGIVGTVTWSAGRYRFTAGNGVSDGEKMLEAENTDYGGLEHWIICTFEFAGVHAGTEKQQIITTVPSDGVNGADEKVSVRMTNTRQVILGAGNSATYDVLSSLVLALNTKYIFVLHARHQILGNNVQELFIYDLNGNLLNTTTTAVPQTGTLIARFWKIGLIQPGSANLNGLDFYLDDFAYFQGVDHPGPCRVATKSPSSVDLDEGWAPTGGADEVVVLNETTGPDGDTSYVTNNTAATTANQIRYNPTLAVLSTFSVEKIYAVIVNSINRFSTASAATYHTGIRVGSSENLAVMANASAYRHYYRHILTNPEGGFAWVPSTVDILKLVLKDVDAFSGRDVRVTVAWVDVLYQVKSGVPPPPPEAGNLATNPDFESGDVEWGKETGWTIENDPGNAHTGSWVAHKVVTAQLHAAIRNLARIPVVLGDTVRIKGWLHSNATASGYGRVRVSWRNAADLEISVSAPAFLPAPQLTWVQQSGDFINTVLGAVFAHVEFEVQFHTTGDWWADDAFIEKIAAAIYPIPPYATRLEDEPADLPESRMEYEEPYVLVIPRGEISAARHRLSYEHQTFEQMKAIRNFYRVQKGVEKPFTFIHPDLNEQELVRFSQEGFRSTFVPGDNVYGFVVDLETAIPLTPFPATAQCYVDFFSRANSAALGSDWVESEKLTTALEIVSNELVMRGIDVPPNDQRCGFALYTGFYGNDQYASLVYKSHIGLPRCGVAVRCSGMWNRFTGYVLMYNVSSNKLAVYQYVEAPLTNLISGVQISPTFGFVGAALANGDRLRLEITGDTMTVRKNTTVLFTLIDRSFKVGGVGIVVTPGSGAGPNSMTWDSWAGGDISCMPT